MYDQLVPGWDIMLKGMDMVRGDQKNAYGKSTYRIFKFTCDEGIKYKDPNTGKTYVVPDQLSANRLDQSHEVVNSEYTDSYSEYHKSRETAYNVQGGVDFKQYDASLTAKYSHEAKKTYDEIKDKTHYMASSVHDWKMYDVDSMPPMIMEKDRSWNMFLRILPKTIKTSADQRKYNQFIGSWGTHYVTRGTIGGYFKFMQYLDNSYTKSHSTSETMDQFSANFHFKCFDLSAGGHKKKSDIHVNNDFKKATHSDTFFRGGLLDLQSNTTMVQWRNSIWSAPDFLNVEIMDLSDLIDDPQIASNVRKNIQYYLQHGKVVSESDEIDYEFAYSDANEDFICVDLLGCWDPHHHSGPSCDFC
eukprot:TRINITY_DN777935_c0_g1_i1.p1 TRINITY_DN777935_c0_g1~~TRINITY_DN777935_c0_g1_i1.p1  ORF type:complete len:392 (-),score=59.49 TRINITY_DN777935_c0_g1_i1:204-1280(-)